MKSKHLTKVLAACAVLAVAAAGLAGCGSSTTSSSSSSAAVVSTETSESNTSTASTSTASTDSIDGTWKFDHVEMDGKTITIEELVTATNKAAGTTVSGADLDAAVELTKAGLEAASFAIKGTEMTTMLNGETVTTGTVTVDGDKCTDANGVVYTLKDGKLVTTNTQNGLTVTTVYSKA